MAEKKIFQKVESSLNCFYLNLTSRGVGTCRAPFSQWHPQCSPERWGMLRVPGVSGLTFQPTKNRTSRGCIHFCGAFGSLQFGLPSLGLQKHFSEVREPSREPREPREPRGGSREPRGSSRDSRSSGVEGARGEVKEVPGGFSKRR